MRRAKIVVGVERFSFERASAFFSAHYFFTFGRGDGSSCVTREMHPSCSRHGPSQAGELVFLLFGGRFERERTDEVEFFFPST